MGDPYDLTRFTEAQRGVYERALAELLRGRKESHWMWFVFPQIAGLGLSDMARRYAIASLDEARAYGAHPVLGPRLVAVTEAVCGQAGRSAREILGSPDDLKFRSCMTLFAHAVPDAPIFAEALRLFFDGREDPRTRDILAAGPG